MFQLLIDEGVKLRCTNKFWFHEIYKWNIHIFCLQILQIDKPYNVKAFLYNLNKKKGSGLGSRLACPLENVWNQTFTKTTSHKFQTN